jgi:hypothetical protein
MPYISPDNEYPRYPGDIQIEHPDWEIGDPTPEGWIFVNEVTPPTTTSEQILYEGSPVEEDGSWYQNWLTRDLTPEELEHKNAPITAKEKLKVLGFSDAEVAAIMQSRLF